MVSLAFIFLFLLNPHFATQAGFGLSFAAIYGLVWWFSDDKNYEKRTPLMRIGRIVRIAAETSIVAGIFTAPFIASHFYSVPIYGLIGNLILLPIFSIVIMPLVMIGTLFPVVLPYAHGVYNWALGIAAHVAALPHSVVQTPHISGAALALIIFGFLCLMFIRNIGKFKINILLFFVFASAGVITIIFTPRPIFYSTHDNELIGFARNGALEFNKARASNHYFAFDTWRQLNFESPADKNTRFKCDNGVCRFETQNWTLVYIQKYVPLAKNIVQLCRDENVDFIVSYFDVHAPNCNAKILRGGLVIYESGKIKYTQGKRRWNSNQYSADTK
jgi:competence protein ComEC